MARYSETAMDHFTFPRNWGRMEEAQRIGVAGIPGRGRYLVLYLRLEDETIVQAAYRCHGCGATIAAGSVLTELVEEKTLTECKDITADDVLQALDGLPPDKRHSAGFAVQALQNALETKEDQA